MYASNKSLFLRVSVPSILCRVCSIRRTTHNIFNRGRRGSLAVVKANHQGQGKL